MSYIYDPVIIPASVVDTGVSIDYSLLGAMGEVDIRNAGPDEVFIAYNGMPPSAAIQNGVARLQVNEALNLKNLQVMSLGLITALGETATVETVAVRRSDGGSGFA